MKIAGKMSCHVINCSGKYYQIFEPRTKILPRRRLHTTKIQVSHRKDFSWAANLYVPVWRIWPYKLRTRPLT